MPKKSGFFDLKITSIECPFCANKRKTKLLDYDLIEMICCRCQKRIVMKIQNYSPNRNMNKFWLKWLSEDIDRK